MDNNTFLNSSSFDGSSGLSNNNVLTYNLGFNKSLANNGSVEFTNSVAKADSDDWSDHWSHSVDMAAVARDLLTQPPSLLAFILGILAIIFNISSLLSISQIRMRLTSHLRLIISLAMSDILIGFSVIIYIVNNIVCVPLHPGEGPRNYRKNYWCMFFVAKALNNTALNSTLLNLIGMAVDHYLAILRPLHYPTLMNKTRTSWTLALVWVLAFLAGFSDFVTALPDFKRVERNYTYCEVVYLSPYQAEYITFAAAFVGFFFILYCYVKIYLRVHRRQNEPIGNNHLQCSLRYNRRGLITTLLIVGTFVVCWLPMCLFQIIMIIRVKVDHKSVYKKYRVLLKADQYLYDLHLLNAICDPVIYAVRMAEVQLGYKRLLNRLCNVKIRYPTRRFSQLSVGPKLSYFTSLSRVNTDPDIKASGVQFHNKDMVDDLNKAQANYLPIYHMKRKGSRRSSL